MFEKEHVVLDHEVDREGRLDIGRLMEHLNDIMEENAESYGAGADFHLGKGLAWVLTEYAIDIGRLPRKKERIRIGTLPYSFKRSFGYRLYRIQDDEGVDIITGKGKFLLIDIRTKAIVKPTKALLDKFTDATKEPRSLPFPKWRGVDAPLRKKERVVVERGHIDANGHVNNARYVRFALHVLAEAGDTIHPLRGIQVRYRKEAFFGDELDIGLFDHPEGLHVAIHRENELTTEILFRSL